MSCKLCLNKAIEREKEGKEERREEEKIRKEKKYSSGFFMQKKIISDRKPKMHKGTKSKKDKS